MGPLCLAIAEALLVTAVEAEKAGTRPIYKRRPSFCPTCPHVLASGSRPGFCYLFSIPHFMALGPRQERTLKVAHWLLITLILEGLASFWAFQKGVSP